jgi:hypothetical protein
MAKQSQKHTKHDARENEKNRESEHCRTKHYGHGN